MSEFKSGQIRVFDHSGAPLGVLTGFSVTGTPSYRLNQVEDLQFFVPRNDGPVSLLYDAAEPTVEGAVTGDSDTGELRLSQHVDTALDDGLIAVIAYDTNQTIDHVYVEPPSGWQEVLVSELNAGQERGLHVFSRVVRPGTPVSHTFRLRARDDEAVTALSMQGALLSVRNLRHDLRMGVRVMDLDSSKTASANTAHAVYAPANGAINPITILAWVLGSGHGTITDATGTAQQAEVVGSAQSLHVATRIEVVHDDTSLVALLTSQNAVTSVAAAITLYPVPGVMQLLQRDNLLLVQNEHDQRAWAGEIDGVTFNALGADVRCLGTMNLFQSLPAENIEQDGGEASTIAWRLVQAANTWKGAHGDMLIGFTIDASNENYGLFEYEGDIFAGLSSLLTRTISEAYMESGISAEDGYLWTTLHWGAEYDIDMTHITLRDGVGGNLAPGTTVDFTGSQRVNYGRLLGSETNIEEYLDYEAVMTVTADIIPEASAVIPEPKMPGARRRAALDLSVDWGLPKAREEKLAREAQALYLDYYKRFLYAYHERWGMPFLPGFEWSGPESDQFRKMSGRNYRTTNVLASLADKEIVTDWDPEAEADVEIEGWYHIEDITNVNNPRGVAYDHTEPSWRYIGRGEDNSLSSLRAEEPYDISETVLPTLVRYGGEYLISIDSSETDPGSIWALTSNGTYTYVRRWDIESGTPLREWRVTESAMTDFTVQPKRGLCFTVRSSDGSIQKRDLNSGELLTTYSSDLTDLRGVSVSNDFVYVLGVAGDIEIWSVTDAGLAGKFTTSVPDGKVPGGIFVDPANSQVWMWYRTGGGVVSLYSAAIAVDESDGGGPVDGVPGFDQISAGAFVRIVMSDTRDLGEPPESIRGIKSVLHRNQFGRYVDGRWTSWGTKYDKYNCSFASHAMLLDRHTYGKVQVTPKHLRNLSGDTSGGSNMKFNAIAWKKMGYKLNYTDDGAWSGVIDRLREGRGVVLFGDMDQVPERYKCQAAYGGDHAVYVHKIDGEGRFVVHDPLCRKLKRIPSSYMRRYAGKFVGTMGRAIYSWSKVTSQRTQAADTKSVFVVWSEGEYKDVYTPGSPGEPATVTRTWDPKEQKKGFKKDSKVTIESVEQVILGEEGRVADWSPTSMGYGVKGPHYYRARDGAVMKATGWHLRPWDIPLATFSLGLPDWPEGVAYLKRLMQKFNREQGSQVFEVLNVDGLWGDIVLGGRYTIDCTLVGAPETGITGEVRVIEYSVDTYNGRMQVLAEWLG